MYVCGSFSLSLSFFSTLETRHQTRTPEGGLKHPGLNSSVPSLPPCRHDAPIAVPRRSSNPPPRRSRAASTVDQQSAHRDGRRRRKHAMPQNQSSAHPCPVLPLRIRLLINTAASPRRIQRCPVIGQVLCRYPLSALLEHPLEVLHSRALQCASQ